MQYIRIKITAFFLFLLICPSLLHAQVNTVHYGKNRVQYKKINWKFYQTRNFNTYFGQGGIETAKFVAQVAEEELASIEKEVEYAMQRRANLVVYNTYDDYKSSNIGIGTDWQAAGGMTKLVNNKVILYFDGNHANLRLQVREGIARILVDNLLFGDDIGEIASNQALLDLPKWLTDGYVSYVAQPWSTEKDDDLKSAMLGGSYKNFYQFAFDRPDLAGHSFWHYIAQKYKKENVTYFLYLARLYKNLNSASEKICKKKFKEVLNDFMQYEQDVYMKDIRQRRNAPKGRLSVAEEISDKKDYYHFAANPNNRDNSYAVAQYKKGVYSIKFVDNLTDEHTLLSYGVRTQLGDINPNYPILSWDGKGTRLLVIYWREGKIHMFVYDVVARIKRFKQEITGFEQILSAGFMLDANTLLLSAVKKGQSDIFTYKIDKEKIVQVTNDTYDDLDATFVSFPNRSGIIFSSDRPVKKDTALVLSNKNRYNVFIVDIDNKSEFKQIVPLTNMKYGNARYPMQYNTNHFTFVSDENGIGNRWAGFFTTARDGIDTLFYIGDELLRNPTKKEMDSTLQAWQKEKPDSVSYFQVYKDSTYTFPITNYQSSLIETRIAGDKGQVSEVRREGDYKFLYKLRLDSMVLRKRNINARPTEYMKSLMQGVKTQVGRPIVTGKKGKATTKTDTAATATTPKKVFQHEFEEEEKADTLRKTDAAALALSKIPDVTKQQQEEWENAKLFKYRLKFSADFLVAGVTNNVLINRYQPYQGGIGPINLNNNSDIDFTFTAGVSDLFEDQKIVGGFKIGDNFVDKTVLIGYQNLRRRLDWGFTYYRNNVKDYVNFYKEQPYSFYQNMLYTNLFQVNLAYPLNEVKSVRANIGYRTDRGVLKPFPYEIFAPVPDPTILARPDSITKTLLARLEYVHDNTINPIQNIWNGLRWKVYVDFTYPLEKGASVKDRKILTVGADARYYAKIYRNFIWAGRAAIDMSFGEQKMIYYLGGADGWIGAKFNNNNRPDSTQRYVYQTLALNMRGFEQNIANGNNALVLNSEFRLPVFSTLINNPINSAFIRNFQLVQFIDLGNAWNGSIANFKRPTNVYSNNPVIVKIKAPGIGPFVGGYGFGARTTLLGYFMKLDAGWPMNGLFAGKPRWYFALGLDF